MVVRKGAYVSTLVALALAVGVPVQARIAANGITTNRIAANRIAANTIASNKLSSNRVAGNSLAANSGEGAFSDVMAIELPGGKLVTR